LQPMPFVPAVHAATSAGGALAARPTPERVVEPGVVSQAIHHWVNRLFGISVERQADALETIGSWRVPHVTEQLAPTSADGVVGGVLLVESVRDLIARGIEENRLLAKLRRDPDLWPTWAEIRAAGMLARTASEDDELILEADRAAGRHADFVFAATAEEPRHSIEFKAIGLSDIEVDFCRRMAPQLPGLIPRRGIVTTHVLETDLDLNVARAERRYMHRQAERLERNLPSFLRGFAAAVAVGHGTEASYVRRLRNRFGEAIDQLPRDDACWIAFHWTNGAPVALVRQALASLAVPDHIVGILLVGSVGTPGRLDNYLVWFLAPFDEEGETEWQSDDVELAKTIFERVNESAGVRPTHMRVPWAGAMVDFLKRDGSRRIDPYNLVLSPDPEDVIQVGGVDSRA
jgi:hypothetical protein